MKNKTFFYLLLITTLFFCSSPPKPGTGNLKKPDIFGDTALLALCLPLEKISLVVVPEKDLAALKKTNPSYLFTKKLNTQNTIKNDTFLIDLANTLLLFEITQRCKPVLLEQRDGSQGAAVPSDNSLMQPIRWSRLAGDTANSFDSVSLAIRRLAEQYATDVVVVPYQCSLAEQASRKKGWRDDKYGTYYEKPSKVNARAEFLVQIWDKQGRLIDERIGTGYSTEPALYGTFKQTRPSNQSPVDFSRNIFAPTLVRALGVACKNLFEN